MFFTFLPLNLRGWLSELTEAFIFYFVSVKFICEIALAFGQVNQAAIPPSSSGQFS